jgi:hypothetical protein
LVSSSNSANLKIGTISTGNSLKEEPLPKSSRSLFTGNTLCALTVNLLEALRYKDNQDLAYQEEMTLESTIFVFSAVESTEKFPAGSTSVTTEWETGKAPSI